MFTNKSEQAIALAALILADESIGITSEKLQTLLKAAGIEEVEPVWTTLFAKVLEDKDIHDLLTAISATKVGSVPPIDVEEDESKKGELGVDETYAIDICGSDESDGDFALDLFT